MVLGIGSHINMDELVQISGDEQFAFNNLTQTDTIDQFLSTFKRFSVGERCEYSRGPNGADIKCNADSMEVNVSLEKPLKGHMYVTGHFNDQKCVVRSNTTEVSLNLVLGDCGISHQFSVNPKGFFFEANVVLQFHPVFSASTDKSFKVYCFYHDRTDPSEIDWQLINEHTQRKKKDNNSMPCTYTISPKASDEEQCGNTINVQLGSKITHNWRCDSDHYDTYQSMLVHSCFAKDLKSGREHMIIDDSGCSLEPGLISTPRYSDSLRAVSDGIAFRHSDSSLLQIRCSMRLCDRLMGECESILPPKCEGRSKRQVGFPVGIRSLTGGEAPPLVTFNRQKADKFKAFSKRRRVLEPLVEQQVRFTYASDALQTVGATQVIELTTIPIAQTTMSSTTEQHPTTDTNNHSAQDRQDASASTSVEDNSADVRPESTQELNISTDDPFQEKRHEKANDRENDESLQNVLPPELADQLLKKFSSTEITIESRTLFVQDSQETEVCRDNTKSR